MSIESLDTQKTVKDYAKKGESYLFKGQESFFKLLVAQMKNQDPMKPMNSDEFTKQIFTLGIVEESIKTNKKLDEIAKSINQLNSKFEESEKKQ